MDSTPVSALQLHQLAKDSQAIYTHAPMTKDKDAKETGDSRLYDARVVERNIKRGIITRKDYEKYLKSLPDMKDKTKTTE